MKLSLDHLIFLVSIKTLELFTPRYQFNTLSLCAELHELNPAIEIFLKILGHNRQRK